MKTTALILMVTLFSGAQMNAQEKQMADPSATKISWYGDKIIGSAHTGTIGLIDGWLSTEGNVITGGEFRVDMKSMVNTDIKDEKMRERLIGHLKSDDFFGVEKYPEAKLVVTGSSEFTDGKATVRGNLTVKEATHPVEFTALWSKSGEVSTYTATIVFDRSKYDVRFGSGKFFSNLGDNAINDEIKLEVQLVVK
jgi:polyisoprenoid-binding protein YceI